ncbi:MAG TPA: RloB domain-containing protein [Pseudobacteroides sp.]|nr:RloB domain-containing protein [Pseudobacteroides sp.]
MSGKERRGKRMDRNRTLSTRIPTLGYYLIVTDTQETEKNYFEGLRKIIPENLKDRLVIKVEKARTVDLVARCKDLVSKDQQYRIPWIVLDRDQVEGFDSIIEKAARNDISVGWSNPCIEIWFFAYFGIGETLKRLYNYSYQICGENISANYRVNVVESHHIKPFVETLNNDANNLIVICPNHHRIIHKAKPVFLQEKIIFCLS